MIAISNDEEQMIDDLAFILNAIGIINDNEQMHIYGLTVTARERYHNREVTDNE